MAERNEAWTIGYLRDLGLLEQWGRDTGLGPALLHDCEQHATWLLTLHRYDSSRHRRSRWQETRQGICRLCGECVRKVEPVVPSAHTPATRRGT